MQFTPLSSRNNRITLLIGCLIAMAVVLLLFRFYWTDNLTYWSLTWNLFLASVPFAISVAGRFYEKKLTPITILPLTAIWLLFFPNAPYILTDLFHLQTRGGMPKWFDLLMVLTFAWTGLIMGIASLMNIQHLISKLYSKATGWFVAIISIILGSFGIYLGRFLRWNSWDIVTTPEPLMRDIYQILINPISHPRTVGMTLVFSAFLILVYMTFIFIRPENKGGS